MSYRSDEQEWPADPQSAAYRESTDTDQWNDDMNVLVAEQGAVYHEPLTDLSQIRAPEDYEADGWDEAREPPKTHPEAQQALQQRIADPAAPDTEAEAGAYDEEGD